MKKLKRVIKILSFLLLSLILTSIIFSLFFGKKTEKMIFNKINSAINTELILSEIEFSLLKKFPSASITFSNILINDSYKDLQDTLIFAEEVIIKLNLIDIYYGDYSLKNIELYNSYINLKYNEKGESNFNLLKNKSKDKNNIAIKNINLKNSKIQFTSLSDSLHLNFFPHELNFSFKDINNTNEIVILGSFLSKELSVDSIDYISNKEIIVDAKLTISDSIKIENGKLNINKIDFENLDFNYFNNTWQLNCKLRNSKLYDITETVPDKYKYILDNHYLSGNTSGNISIYKDMKFINPYCNIDLKVNNGIYNLLSNDFKLENITTSLNFNNGKERNFSTSKFLFSSFKSIKKEGVFNGEFVITNLNKYYLNANFYSSWNLSELNNFNDKSHFKNIKGDIEGTLNYNGYLSFEKDMKKHFASSSHKANLDFKNVSFNYKESDLYFSSKKMNWDIEDNIVDINNDVLYISGTDFNLDVKIDKLILYILDQVNQINIVGQIKSEKVIFEELMKIIDINGEKSREFISVLPNWFNTNIEIDISQFYYKNFNALKLVGDIKYDSKKLKLNCDNIKMNTLDGDISGEVIYFENRLHDLVLKSNIALNKVNISEGFKSFDNFGQKFITNRNIKGKTTSNIYIQAMWDKNYKFYESSLSLNAQLIINNGELNNFEPMYNLSDYVSIDELKNVKFATLKNNIRIENRKIIIPEMDINSSAFSVYISGNHSFENIMDYKVRLLLSDVLSKKSKNKSNIEKENYNIDKSGKTTIQLNMKGHIDNTKISLDKVKIKKDVLKEIKNEISEVIDVIGDNILNNNKTEKDSINQQENNIEIEWDDEKLK